MQLIIFHKVDVPGPPLGRGSLWFDSCKRPPSLCILGGRLREVQLYIQKFRIPFRVGIYWCEHSPKRRLAMVKACFNPRVCWARLPTAVLQMSPRSYLKRGSEREAENEPWCTLKAKTE